MKQLEWKLKHRPLGFCTKDDTTSGENLSLMELKRLDLVELFNRYSCSKDHKFLSVTMSTREKTLLQDSAVRRKGKSRKFVDSFTPFSDLVAILYDDTEHPLVLEDAIKAVCRQASDSGNRWQILEFPHALEGLALLLFKDDEPEVQRNSAWALANLASSHAFRNKLKIAAVPNVLQGLAELLQKDDNPGIQEEAARAFRNLACEARNNQTISECPGALSSLLRFLTDKDGSPEVQMQSSMAVINLLGNSVATRTVTEGANPLKRKEPMSVLACPDALTEVVKLLFPDGSLELQVQAAYALIDLVESTLVNKDALLTNSSTGKGNVEKTADFPDALTDLIRLFSYDPLETYPPGVLS
ncbi:hypothetical protein R1sor_000204 [Riccia sorocarpa]|uniref:Vacuolar protein 8 n=1 Tax=Riccia sorocarpa TaxID=122646 RepID=A0ABD3GUT7_9MARC